MARPDWMLAWSDGMAMGIPELDAADRRICALLQELNRAIAGDGEGEDLQPLMNQLVRDAFGHFEQEERVLAQCAYPLSKGHAALHLQVRAELEHALQELRITRIPALRAEYVLLVTQLLVEHMRQETLKYLHFLRGTTDKGTLGA